MRLRLQASSIDLRLSFFFGNVRILRIMSFSDLDLSDEIKSFNLDVSFSHQLSNRVRKNKCLALSIVTRHCSPD